MCSLQVVQGFVADQPWVQGAEERPPALVVEAQLQHALGRRVLMAQAFNSIDFLHQHVQLADHVVGIILLEFLYQQRH